MTDQAAGSSAVPERHRLIVGIGASAGGIDALKTFFSIVPADIGMAFVIVQHLDPNFESSLVPIIAGASNLPVRLAEDGMRIDTDQVYVIPRNTILTVNQGRLHLSTPAPPAARRVSINTFLLSLAEDQGENAVAIILSGFGSDGALGIAAIKEHGGLTLSQAEYDHHAKKGMPQSAASSGFVDHVLAVEDMPQALLDYRQHRAIFDASKGPDGIRQDLPSHLATICAVLHARLGRDFGDYKTGTLMRRIQRRMHVLQTKEVATYVQQLRTLPHEPEMLFREMLISVTRFFRDRDAFAALDSRIIPELFADQTSSEPIRVWVVGCATGEEAYSVAILLKEARMRSDSGRQIQVFATDVDDRAIALARAGLYAGAIVADMPPDRLERNFTKEDGNYRVAKDIREMCLFSTHDLIKDPPFSRIDLVCCRNLLIYFEPQLQQRVITTFHYALRPNRFLFLGTSEGVASQALLFTPIDKRFRLYARRDTTASMPAFTLSRSAELTTPARLAARVPVDDLDRRVARAGARYAPAYLVVDKQFDVLRFSGQTSIYLQPVTGVASLNLFALLHSELRVIARAALKEAAVTGERVVNEALRIEVGEGSELLNLIVEPLFSAGDSGMFLVLFQKSGSVVQSAVAPSATVTEDSQAAQARNQDLLMTKERLRTVSEELESTVEELQSSNEEYLSVNEELQSANEELEASKEELQSLNEELQTINAELGTRNDSLVRSNSDLANLFDSTSIATLFLDRTMHIRRFTPRLLDIFNVREGDEGRPISDIVTNLSGDGLEQDVQQVLRSLIPSEREVVVTGSGASYLMQVRPYRDLNNVIDGAVITFVDISERKTHEQARSKLAAIVDSSQDAIIGHDVNGLVTSWNGAAERLFGIDASMAIGRPLPVLLKDGALCDWKAMVAVLENGSPPPSFECEGTNGTGQPVLVSVTVSPVRDGSGTLAGVSVVVCDISARKAAERKATLLLGELDHRVKNILAIVSAVITQTLNTTLSPAAFAEEIGGRIQSIAKAHSLLTQSGQGEVSLRSILDTELAPYDRGDGNVGVTGQDIALTPKAGLALAMAVHELASNAAKYGALNTTAGKLTVASDVVPGRAGPEGAPAQLTLVWTERGGPAVSPPTKRGFGTTLIERALTHEIDAEVRRSFETAGLVCTIVIPLTDEVGRVQSEL